MTSLMLKRVEELKAAYAAIIQAADGVGMELEFGQWRRMNTLICYLEERAARG